MRQHIAVALLLAATFGAAAALIWGRRVAIALALVVFSHWLLDLVVHRMDMPLLPGNLGDLPRLGLGLWRFPWLSAATELALVAGGAWLYWLAASELHESAQNRAKLVALLILLGGVATLFLDFTGILV